MDRVTQANSILKFWEATDETDGFILWSHTQNLLDRLLTLSGGIFYKLGTNFANINIAFTLQHAGRRQNTQKRRKAYFCWQKRHGKKHLQGKMCAIWQNTKFVKKANMANRACSGRNFRIVKCDPKCYTAWEVLTWEFLILSLLTQKAQTFLRRSCKLRKLHKIIYKMVSVWRGKNK